MGGAETRVAAKGILVVHSYAFIKKEWIVSMTARRVYRTAAVVSLIMYPLLVAARLNQPVPLMKQLLLASLLATATNALAMETFLFRFDTSPALKQVLWFCAMIFIPLGPALYCFFVYSCSEAIQEARAVDPNRLQAKL